MSDESCSEENLQRLADEITDVVFRMFFTLAEQNYQIDLQDEFRDLECELPELESETNKISLEERIGAARRVLEDTYYYKICIKLAAFFNFYNSVKEELIRNFKSVEHGEQDPESKSSLDHDTESEPEPETDPNRWFDFDNLYYICLEYLIQRGFTMDLAHIVILNEIFIDRELKPQFFRRKQYYLEKDFEKIVLYFSSLQTQRDYGCYDALCDYYWGAIDAILELYATRVELNGLSGAGGAGGAGSAGGAGGAGGGVGVAVAEEEV